MTRETPTSLHPDPPQGEEVFTNPKQPGPSPSQEERPKTPEELRQEMLRNASEEELMGWNQDIARVQQKITLYEDTFTTLTTDINKIPPPPDETAALQKQIIQESLSSLQNPPVTARLQEDQREVYQITAETKSGIRTLDEELKTLFNELRRKFPDNIESSLKSINTSSTLGYLPQKVVALMQTDPRETPPQIYFPNINELKRQLQRVKQLIEAELERRAEAQKQQAKGGRHVRTASSRPKTNLKGPRQTPSQRLSRATTPPTEKRGPEVATKASTPPKQTPGPTHPSVSEGGSNPSAKEEATPSPEVPLSEPLQELVGDLRDPARRWNALHTALFILRGDPPQNLRSPTANVPEYIKEHAEEILEEAQRPQTVAALINAVVEAARDPQNQEVTSIKALITLADIVKIPFQDPNRMQLFSPEILVKSVQAIAEMPANPTISSWKLDQLRKLQEVVSKSRHVPAETKNAVSAAIQEALKKAEREATSLQERQLAEAKTPPSPYQIEFLDPLKPHSIQLEKGTVEISPGTLRPTALIRTPEGVILLPLNAQFDEQAQKEIQKKIAQEIAKVSKDGGSPTFKNLLHRLSQLEVYGTPRSNPIAITNKGEVYSVAHPEPRKTDGGVVYNFPRKLPPSYLSQPQIRHWGTVSPEGKIVLQDDNLEIAIRKPHLSPELQDALREINPSLIVNVEKQGQWGSITQQWELFKHAIATSNTPEEALRKALELTPTHPNSPRILENLDTYIGQLQTLRGEDLKKLLAKFPRANGIRALAHAVVAKAEAPDTTYERQIQIGLERRQTAELNRQRQQHRKPPGSPPTQGKRTPARRPPPRQGRPRPQRGRIRSHMTEAREQTSLRDRIKAFIMKARVRLARIIMPEEPPRGSRLRRSPVLV